MNAAPRASIHIDAAHPALSGHFPGRPTVPGVLLLDEVLSALERMLPSAAGPIRWRIGAVKFHRAVAGGTLELSYSSVRGELSFELHSGQALVASGTLAQVPSHG